VVESANGCSHGWRSREERAQEAKGAEAVALQQDESGRTRVDLQYLRAWRLAKLLSQDELVARSGVAKSTIVKLETRRQRANLATVGRLAKALGIAREQLVYEAPPAPQNPQTHGQAEP
jgi:DNA-binding XRE family transcriptional regulator